MIILSIAANDVPCMGTLLGDCPNGIDAFDPQLLEQVLCGAGISRTDGHPVYQGTVNILVIR